MSFIFATVGISLILLLFGVRDARRIRGSHGECAAFDVSVMASTRFLVWGIAISVAVLALLPAASATEARIAVVGADLVLVAVVLLLRREARRSTHVRRS